MLPLSIPEADLKQWQKTFNDFIWDKKQHRISFKIMRQAVKSGGMGIPNLRLYHEGANLATITRLTDQTTSSDRTKVELNFLKTMTGHELLWQTPKQRKQLQIPNTYLSTTLAIWDKRRCKLVRKYLRMMTLTHHGWFTSDVEKVIKEWKPEGGMRIKDVTKKGQLLQKQDLENMLQKKLMWIHYFQLRLTLTQKCVKDLLKNMMSFELLLDMGDTSTKHKLSTIYKILLSLDPEPFKPTLAKWRRDCRKTLTDQDWNILQHSYAMTTSSLLLKLQMIKLLYRWYLTPKQLNHIYKTSKVFCWKDCQAEADYLHCWWTCPVIQNFWTKVCDTINKISNYRLKLNPEVVLLHLWDTELPRTLDQTVAILLIFAKLEIASKWKCDKGPLLSNWYDRLWNGFVMAKITDKVLRETQAGYKSRLKDVWAPIIQF